MTATATTETADVGSLPDLSDTPAVLPWVTPEWLTSRHTEPFPEPDSLDLLKDRPLKKRRARAIIPAVILLTMAGGYAGSTLLFPLTNLPPTVTKTPVSLVAAAPALPSWPVSGSAGVGVQGVGSVSSTVQPESMASITKVITAMVVLDALPLAVGETGPDYYFTQYDSDMYWQYLQNDESALDVPVDGSLSQYQLLQGILMGSAGNYTDFLVEQIWGSEEEYAAAAMDWLRRNAISGITVVEATGINPANVAVPGALARLAEVALENPVFAEIVATPVASIPGNEYPVENTNNLLADPGVIGVKTGSLEGHNLLTAKEVTVDGTTVRLFASVIDQPDRAIRDAESRRLLADLEVDLAPTKAVGAGTPVGNIATAWGAQAELRTASDITLILWNSGAGTAEVSLSVGDDWSKGAAAGSLTATGPLNSSDTSIVLASDLAAPSAWWRLTHPLELWGLV